MKRTVWGCHSNEHQSYLLDVQCSCQSCLPTSSLTHVLSLLRAAGSRLSGLGQSLLAATSTHSCGPDVHKLIQGIDTRSSWPILAAGCVVMRSGTAAAAARCAASQPACRGCSHVRQPSICPTGDTQWLAYRIDARISLRVRMKQIQGHALDE